MKKSPVLLLCAGASLILSGCGLGGVKGASPQVTPSQSSQKTTQAPTVPIVQKAKPTQPPDVAISSLKPAPPGHVDSVHYFALAKRGSEQIVVRSTKDLGLHVIQRYLSIYSYVNGTWKQVFQAPGNPPLSQQVIDKQTVNLPASMTFHVVGASDLLSNGQKQLVTSFYTNTGAGCGSASVSVLSYQNGKFTMPLFVSNGCALSASLAQNRLILKGPYFGPNAAMAPTDPHAVAVVTYDPKTQGWVEKPTNYFPLNPGNPG